MIWRLTFEQLQLGATLLVQVASLGHTTRHSQQILGTNGLHGGRPMHFLSCHEAAIEAKETGLSWGRQREQVGRGSWEDISKI